MGFNWVRVLVLNQKLLIDPSIKSGYKLFLVRLVDLQIVKSNKYNNRRGVSRGKSMQMEDLTAAGLTFIMALSLSPLKTFAGGCIAFFVIN